MRLLQTVLAAALLAGCAGDDFQASDTSDCITRYSVPAGTEKGVRYAAGFCHQAFAEATTDEQRAFVRCMLPKMAVARTDTGLQAASVACRRDAD